MSVPPSSMTFQQAKEHIEAMRGAANDQFHAALRLDYPQDASMYGDRSRILDKVLTILDKVQP